MVYPYDKGAELGHQLGIYFDRHLYRVEFRMHHGYLIQAFMGLTDKNKSFSLHMLADNNILNGVVNHYAKFARNESEYRMDLTVPGKLPLYGIENTLADIVRNAICAKGADHPDEVAAEILNELIYDELETNRVLLLDVKDIYDVIAASDYIASDRKHILYEACLNVCNSRRRFREIFVGQRELYDEFIDKLTAPKLVTITSK